jgi:hypothetical protein
LCWARQSCGRLSESLAAQPAPLALAAHTAATGESSGDRCHHLPADELDWWPESGSFSNWPVKRGKKQEKSRGQICFIVFPRSWRLFQLLSSHFFFGMFVKTGPQLITGRTSMDFFSNRK